MGSIELLPFKRSKKVAIAIGFGLLGFLCSRYAIHYNSGPFNISITWSFIFSLVIARAYGPLFGLISGGLGLGAAFPFVLWPNNGWANLMTMSLYLLWFVYQSYFDQMYAKKPKWRYYQLVVFVPYVIFYSLMLAIFYPVLFSFNPPFWNVDTATTIASATLRSIIIKEVVILSSALFFSSCMMRVTPFRKLLGLPIKEKQKSNFKIFMVAMICALVTWSIFIVFVQIFITNNFPYNPFPFTNPYFLIGLIVIVIVEIIIAEFVMMFFERKHVLEQTLQAKDQQIRSISDNLESGMIYQLVVYDDGRREFKYVSQSVEHLYGVSAEAVYKDASLVYSRIHPDDYRLLQDIEKQASDEMKSFSCEVRLRNTDDTYRWVSLTSNPRQEEQAIVWDGLEFIITQQKEKQQYIEHLSNHDVLTNLYNRRYYKKMLEEYDNPQSLPLSMIMADVNGLKLINDAFGHEAGDELLVGVANAINKELLPDMVAARMGGDEFVILLPNTTMLETDLLIERIKFSVEMIELKLGFVSVSFGHHTRVSMMEPISELFTISENNMYSRKINESKSMRNEAVKMIMTTLFEKNAREKLHCERVSDLCGLIGEAMGMNDDEIDALKTVGLLHDIGKIGVEDYILNKTDQLTCDEWAKIKRHPEIGYQILHSISEFSLMAEYILHHHERIDGKGYPQGLMGDQLPEQSKILAIADAYDAMTSDRPYRKGCSKQFAISELLKHRGCQFDSGIVDVFVNQVLVDFEQHPQLIIGDQSNMLPQSVC